MDLKRHVRRASRALWTLSRPDLLHFPAVASCLAESARYSLTCVSSRLLILEAEYHALYCATASRVVPRHLYIVSVTQQLHTTRRSVCGPMRRHLADCLLLPNPAVRRVQMLRLVTQVHEVLVQVRALHCRWRPFQQRVDGLWLAQSRVWKTLN
jgi:hypothetical protein